MHGQTQEKDSLEGASEAGDALSSMGTSSEGVALGYYGRGLRPGTAWNGDWNSFRLKRHALAGPFAGFPTRFGHRLINHHNPKTMASQTSWRVK